MSTQSHYKSIPAEDLCETLVKCASLYNEQTMCDVIKAAFANDKSVSTDKIKSIQQIITSVSPEHYALFFESSSAPEFFSKSSVKSDLAFSKLDFGCISKKTVPELEKIQSINKTCLLKAINAQNRDAVLVLSYISMGICKKIGDLMYG